MTEAARKERTPDEFETAVIEFQEGNRTMDSLLAIAMPAIRRMCKATCHEMRCSIDDADDIAQVLAMTFADEIARTYDRSRSIYPLLKTYAQHRALSLAKRTREIQLLGRNLPGDDMDHDQGRGMEDAVTDRLYAERGLAAGLDGNVAQFGRDTVDEGLDKAAALMRIDKTLNSPNGHIAQQAGSGSPPTGEIAVLGEEKSEKELAQHAERDTQRGRVVSMPVRVLAERALQSLPQAVREAKAITNNLAPIGVRLDPSVSQRSNGSPFVRGTMAETHHRLREIKEALQLTTQAMAKELNVEAHTLISYLYGRVKNVPSIVMEKAEALFDNDQTVSRGMRDYKGMTLPEVVNFWMDRYVPKVQDGVKLEAEWDRIRYLANMLKIADTTVMRWAHGQKKSPLSERQLATYEEELRLAKRELPEALRKAATSGRGRGRRPGKSQTKGAANTLEAGQ